MPIKLQTKSQQQKWQELQKRHLFRAGLITACGLARPVDNRVSTLKAEKPFFFPCFHSERTKEDKYFP